MKKTPFGHNPPKLYGTTTVGERGQIVIPAEARRDFEITPNTKLLVFGNKGHGGLMLAKAEAISEFISKTSGMLERLEKLSRAMKEEEETHGSN